MAEPTLLDTYTQERGPVIAEMLNIPSHLFNDFLLHKTGGPDASAVWRRGGDLHQFGINYRWSPILIGERSPKETIPIDPYGHSHSSADIVRAGDRAPDAPGLVVLSSTGRAPEQATTSLFTLLGVSHHTVLIFDKGSVTDKFARVLSDFQVYPAPLLHPILIHADIPISSSLPAVAYLSVVDRDKHAHEAYQLRMDEYMVVIVRPDGIVGGVTCSVDGARRYFDGIFGQLKPERASKL